MTRTHQGPTAQHWLILAAAFVIVFMTVGTRSTLGNFFKAIIADLGWNRSTISFVVAVNIWLSGLLQPFTGHIMDRFGAKWLFTASVTAFGLGVALISLTHSVWYLLIVYGIVMAVATAGASVTLTNALVARWFSHRRGLAIGINNAGAALGQLSLVYLSYILLSSLGWRLSHVYLGLIVLIAALPMALLLPRHTTRKDGLPRPAANQKPPQGPLETQSWSQALRSLPLWQLRGAWWYLARPRLMANRPIARVLEDLPR